MADLDNEQLAAVGGDHAHVAPTVVLGDGSDRFRDDKSGRLDDCREAAARELLQIDRDGRPCGDGLHGGGKTALRQDHRIQVTGQLA